MNYAALFILGVLCILTPPFMYLKDIEWNIDNEDDDSFRSWLMGKPLHTIVLMNAMVISGLFFITGALTGGLIP